MKVLNGKPLWESGFGEGITLKLSFISLKGTFSSKRSLVSKITENMKGKNVKPVSNCGGGSRKEFKSYG